MGKVPMPKLEWIPSPNHYDGRKGYTINNITFHHIVGSVGSAIGTFLNPANQVSSHFLVGPNRIVCMVDTDDAAWTNGSLAANCPSVTIEHEGTWLNGYTNAATLETSAQLVAWLMDLYPNAVAKRHRDFGKTACPGDFPVEKVWERAKAIRASYYAPPVDNRPEWVRNYRPIPSTKYIATNGVTLKDLVTLKPADARVFAQNMKIDIGAVTTVGGKDYMITAYSASKNIGAGFLATDLLASPYVPPTPEPEPELPPVVDPDAGKNWAKENNALLRQILDMLSALTNKILNIFK